MWSTITEMGGWVVTESMADWMDHEYEKWQGDYNWIDELSSFHCLFYFYFLKYWCSAHFRWMHNILGYCKEYWQSEKAHVSTGSNSTARGSLVPGPSYVKKGEIVFLFISFLYFILFLFYYYFFFFLIFFPSLPNQYLRDKWNQRSEMVTEIYAMRFRLYQNIARLRFMKSVKTETHRPNT